jgi:hypothetical protein
MITVGPEPYAAARRVNPSADVTSNSCVAVPVHDGLGFGLEPACGLPPQATINKRRRIPTGTRTS